MLISLLMEATDTNRPVNTPPCQHEACRVAAGLRSSSGRSVAEVEKGALVELVLHPVGSLPCPGERAARVTGCA